MAVDRPHCGSVGGFCDKGVWPLLNYSSLCTEDPDKQLIYSVIMCGDLSNTSKIIHVIFLSHPFGHTFVLFGFIVIFRVNRVFYVMMCLATQKHDSCLRVCVETDHT